MSRYTYRHDSCLNGGTLPPDLALTTSRPDLVLINRSTAPQHVVLAELTMTWDTVANTDRVRDMKEARYQYLTKDIKENRYKCSNMPIEIGEIRKLYCS